MTKRGLIFILLLSASAAAPAAVPYGCPAEAPARALAEAFTARWATAAASGDRAALAALYTEDAVLMPPTDETIVGREPIGDYLAGQDALRRLERYAVDVVACELDGDTLNVAGVWGAEAADYRGARATITGNVLRVLARQRDGNWSLRYEIWN